ncbi:MAG: class I SAM-dependent methyltransferase [Balneolaceae bacterium]
MSDIVKKEFDKVTKKLENWQGREEWFFNREFTDKYEDYYEGPYKRAEIWQKRILGNLITKDDRVKTLLEFGCGTTRFTRWWNEVGIEAAGADISPFMIGHGVRLFDGDLVLADSHHMPFRENSFDALAFVATFAYYQDPVQVIREAARVGKYGMIFGIMNRNSTKVVRRRVQEAFGKNRYYETASFYTPKKLIETIHEALGERLYTIEWTATGLPKWFPVQQWGLPVGDFFGLHLKFTDVE